MWSNRYYVSGPLPADATHWTTFSDAAVNAEKLTLSNVVTIIGTYGYAAGSDVPVFSKTYATAGTAGVTSPGSAVPGECAALVRYSTSARTSKNHPVYLYNYYHGVFNVSAASPDALYAAQKTLMQTYANGWVAGISDGTNLMVRCGPQGQLATAALVEPWITHRDFPRA